mgnify:FL=1
MFNNTYEEIRKAQNNDKEAMDNLVKNNLGLVYNIAKRFMGRGFELEDLIQIGTIGLIKSIKKFDENYNVQLSTYSVPFILGEIKRNIRDDGAIKVSRSLKELSIKIKQLQNEYNVKYGREIKIEEVEKILKVPKEEIISALDATSPGLVGSINEKIGNDNSDRGATIGEIIPDNNNEAQMIANKLTISKLIEELDTREKYIVKLRYFEGKTQAEVAKMIGVSQVQVSRIEKKILLEMKEKIVG